jgi:hypothetical protein
MPHRERSRSAAIGTQKASATSGLGVIGTSGATIATNGRITSGGSDAVRGAGSSRVPSIVRDLFVSDGSLFPTSLGGPPQISIYAFALHLAPHVIDRARA